MLAYAAFSLIAPILVALVMKSGANGGMNLTKVNGKLRYSTRLEDVNHVLKSMEKHGIFTQWGANGSSSDKP
ncbi:MAG: hypothetical protein WCI55_07645 [Armatimonadota bacterium]